jgi:hypothetical protein
MLTNIKDTNPNYKTLEKDTNPNYKTLENKIKITPRIKIGMFLVCENMCYVPTM